jgi:hypothetical protein
MEYAPAWSSDPQAARLCHRELDFLPRSRVGIDQLVLEGRASSFSLRLSFAWVAKLGPGKLVVGSSRQLASANGRQQPQPIPKRLSSYPLPSSGHGIGSNKYLDKAEWASKPLPQCTAMSLLGHSRLGRASSKSGADLKHCHDPTSERGSGMACNRAHGHEELTLENDFLEGALCKAGLLSAKR